MFDCVPKMPLLPVKKRNKSYMVLNNFIQFYVIL